MLMQKRRILSNRYFVRFGFWTTVLSDEFNELSVELDKESSYFLSTTPFLFELTSIQNYTGGFDTAFEQLIRGSNVYYPRNYFGTDFDEDSRFESDYFETSMSMYPHYGLASVKLAKNKQ